MISGLKLEETAEFCNNAISIEANPEGLQLQQGHFGQRVCIRVLNLLVSWDSGGQRELERGPLLQRTDCWEYRQSLPLIPLYLLLLLLELLDLVLQLPDLLLHLLLFNFSLPYNLPQVVLRLLAVFYLLV